MNIHNKNILQLILLFLPFWLNAQFQVTVSVSQPSCFGYTDGRAMATITGGISPYFYKWSNGQMGSQTSSLSAGNYSLTVTDAANTIVVRNFTVMQPAQLIANITAEGGNCDVQPNYIGSATGGMPPYTFKWHNLDNGQTFNSETLINPTRNTYFLEVKDGKGCPANKVLLVEGTLQVSVRVSNVICGGTCDGAAEALVVGGKAPYTYKWNYQAKTTRTIDPVPGGTYTVTVTDANGCQKIASNNVIEPEELKANLKVNGECTDNASASVTPTGGKAPYTIKWSTGATTATVNLPQGVHFVTVTDAFGCNKSEQINISRANGLQVMLMANELKCNSLTTNMEACVPGGGLGPYTFKWSNGMSTQIINNIPAGTYRVTVTDGAGCTDIAEKTVAPPRELRILANATNTFCSNSTGSATVTGIVNGVAPYTYKWSNNQTTVTASGLASGEYSVTVTDAEGCQGIAKITVGTEGGIGNITFSKNDASCNGKTNGNVTAQVAGTGTFNYVWNNGATTPTLSNIGAGTYTVTISNNAGCSGSSSVTIGNIKNLSLKTSTSNAECASNTGAATVTDVLGGVGPFAFKWNNGQTTQTATNLSAGTYSVTVTDAEGCSVSTEGIVVKANGSNISLSLSKIDAACSGVANGSITAIATGAAPITYKWSNGATTSSLTNIGAGTYTLTITDAAGCKAESQITIENARNLTMTTNSTNTDCGVTTGAASVTNVLGGVGPFTYVWSNGQTTQTATNLGAGTYSVTVTDAVGCKVSKNDITVIANAANIAVTQKITDATCNNTNGNVEFTIIGGKEPYSYKWSGGTNTTNLAAGEYTFTITDAQGCSKTESVKINTKGIIKAAFTATPLANSTCDSIRYTFTNTSTGQTTGATYNWRFGNNRTSTAQNPTTTLGGTATQIILIAQSTEGCADTTRQTLNLDFVNVEIPDTAVTCIGGNITVLAKNNNPNTVLTYKWSPDSLIVSGGTTSNPVLQSNNIGNKKVFVEISNGLGCTKQDSVILNAFQKDALKPSDITFKQDCDTRKISFTNNSSLANQYTWRFGDPNNPTAGSTDINPSFTYSQGGTVTVTLIPKISCLDTVKLTVPVRNNQAVSVTANNDTIQCSAASKLLKASSPTATKFEWSINPNFNPILSNKDTLSVNPANRINTYYVRGTDTATGCTGIDTVIINNFALNLSFDTAFNACKGVDTSLTILNRTPTDTLTIAWTPTNIIKGATNQPRVTLNITENATLRTTVKNQYGCTQDLTVAITAREVDAKATVSENVIYVDDVVDINATPTGTGNKYSWTPATDIVNPDSASSKASPKQDVKYTVQVTDQYGCKDTASVTIQVLTPQCAEPYIFIPRAFSPNNDGLNEKVFVRGEYLTDEGFEFAIYNRWGEKVFSTQSRKEGWDGTHNGKAVAPDVYGYYVKGICKKGEVFFKKGNITVLR